MKLITRDTDYALRALCYIAKHNGNRIAVSELVKELKIPRPFLRKILQILDRKGILKSHRGLRGGFLLGKSADRIFLFELIKIFQGPFSLNECFLKKLPCPNKGSCILRKKINRIEGYVISQLQPITIASLLR